MSAPRMAVALVVLGAACGDDLPRAPVVIATSGARLAVSWYRYSDGAEQAGADLYDKVEHTACAPRRWADGVVRCVPVADDAVYVDAACRDAVGRRVTDLEPTHFIAYDAIGRRPVPAHLYRAGRELAAPAEHYELHDGACAGPFPAADGVVYHALAGEIDGATLVELHDDELGTGRLGLGVRWADDGLRLPLGLRDRTLDRPCAPWADPDGGVACAPTDAPRADLFADADCQRPAIAVPALGEVPAVVEVELATGCAGYRMPGAELTGPLFTDASGTCRPRWLGPGERAYAADQPAALPTLDRTIEARADRRLQQIVLRVGADDDADALRFSADALFDTATGAPCAHVDVAGDGLRCVPTELANATLLFTASCGIAVDVVELRPGCGRPAFAWSFTGGVTVFHAIGGPVTEPLYRPDASGCRVYVPPPGHELRTLGPALAPAPFLRAIYFGER